MDYDPIKDRLGSWFDKSPGRFRLFFGLLQLFFLRAWHVRRALRKAIHRMSEKKTLEVLDAGTGFGQFADYLVRSDERIRVHAVDIKPDYLKRLEGYFAQTGRIDQVSIGEDDLTRLQAEGPYDLILSVDVMEHIEDDRAVFRNFANVLRPGGEVIINTPSDQGGSAVGGEGEESFIGEHVRDGYSVQEIDEKLRTAGLTPVSIRYTYGTWGSLGWRLLIQIPMKLLGIGFWTLPIVALYYVPAFPVGMLLNALDLVAANKTGTGLIVLARKDPA